MNLMNNKLPFKSFLMADSKEVLKWTEFDWMDLAEKNFYNKDYYKWTNNNQTEKMWNRIGGRINWYVEGIIWCK